jgi:hypothetical protein
MIITGAHSRATPFFDNSTAVGAAFPRQLYGINQRHGASGLAFFAPRRLCGSTALRNSRKIARIQMRNGRQQPFHRQRPKTLARSDLQQLCPSPPSRPMRKIRDLIIFRENHAQMRNNSPYYAPRRLFVSKPLSNARLSRGTKTIFRVPASTSYYFVWRSK